MLISAPTGSGKTLTAFLSALNRFISGESPGGATRVLYVSPLKALNNDIQRNLLSPLQELKALQSNHEIRDPETFPEIRVQTRSGDTPQNERQRMLRRPPEILITTPESLNLLLTTARGRLALSQLETVILDEIHALADNRRGVQLMTALERLEWLCTGSFQRIALSATVNPMAEIACYVGGFLPSGKPRPVRQILSEDRKDQHFTVRFPPAAREAALEGKKIWEPLSDEFRRLLERNQSTLFFTNSRRLAEKITLKINQDEVVPVAYAHHGSLAREIRQEVESRLKEGTLKAIVATSSLEMGIDIGHLDEVVMIQSPPTIAATIQRMGRAGHSVGETSRGTLFPTHAQDFIEAATLAPAVAENDIEPLRFLNNPLDVLAQIIISMTATETWHKHDLLELLRGSHPYRDLPDKHFDLVVDMLAGRYSGSRVRDLKPRLAFDRLANTLRANKAAQLALYNAGGTIPDRGYYKLRHIDSGAVIGELDEEFVWEAQLGQTFTLGSQYWQIQRITHNDVMVRVAENRSTPPPFWRSETFNRSFHFSSRMGNFLETCNTHFIHRTTAELRQELCDQRGFEASAAEELLDFLNRQREHTGADLPHRKHLVIEHINAGPGGYQSTAGEQQIVLHTYWGGQVNQPLALALDAAWQATFENDPEIYADNNAIVVQTKEFVDPDRVLGLVNPLNLNELLRDSLENSGFFGARFRECAGRALLLNRKRFNQRLPLWMSRQQAKKLMASVKEFKDFPILLETWRSCLKDEFDLAALGQILMELEQGDIRTSHVTTTTPSPFAAGISYNQINRYMYADDTPDAQASGATSNLTDTLIRSTAFEDGFELSIGSEIIDEFLAKRQRTATGYAPRNLTDLKEWVKERILTPLVEWEDLINACVAGGLEQKPELVHPLRLLQSGSRRWVVHQENMPLLARCFPDLSAADLEPGSDQADLNDLAAPKDPRDQEQVLKEILSFYGPLDETQILRLFPLARESLIQVLLSLTDAGDLLLGHWRAGEDTLTHCDASNFETLLRFQRAARREVFSLNPVTALPGYLALWQRFSSDSNRDITASLNQLAGYVAPVATWLKDLIPARQGFEATTAVTAPLDDALADGSFCWLGGGEGRLTLAADDCLDLIRFDRKEMTEGGITILQAFSDPRARYSFFQLVDNSGLTPENCSEQLWQAVWRGEISADSLLPLRQGMERRFKLSSDTHRPDRQDSTPMPQAMVRSRSRRLRRRSRQISQGWAGGWYLVECEESDQSEPASLERLERFKDQARLLLERYGVLCRELVEREGGAFRWRNLFRALRLMEFSGEVVSGLYFEQLSGPQFASPQALGLLQGCQQQAPSFWVSAFDPVAPSGLSLNWPDTTLPARRAGNHLAFHAGRLAMISERWGDSLTFLAEPESSVQLDACLALLRHLQRSHRNLQVTRINGLSARESPHLVWLGDHFRLHRDYKCISLSD